MKPRIEVQYRFVPQEDWATTRFKNWWEFADWLKQCNENEHVVTIACWTYVHAKR